MWLTDLKDKMASQNALQPPKRTEVIDNVWKTRLAESFEGFSASQVSRDHIERAKECIDKGGTRDERYRLVPFERILNENQVSITHTHTHTQVPEFMYTCTLFNTFYSRNLEKQTTLPQ